jgi:outer membrane lipoprotein-sorting protein
MKSLNLKFFRSASLIALLIFSGVSLAQNSPRNVLDKAAATLNGSGVTASFSINLFNGTKLQGSSNGSISIKGNKFHASTSQNIIWFDGKTEWTYVKKNDEVNVSNPTEAQLQSMNPYRFINLYKNGFNLSMGNTTLRGISAYSVHLKAQNKNSEIQEVYIVVNKSNYQPMSVRMRKGAKQWYSISISGLEYKYLNDNIFHFNHKDFPKAEIIDLR